MHSRPDTWPDDLAAFVEAHRAAPFAWGTHDCCTLVCDWAMRLGHADPMAHLRGLYADEASAEAITEAHGGFDATVEDCLAVFPELPPTQAHRGDIVMAAWGNIRAVGILLGNAVAVPGPDGMSFLPRASMRRAWRL